MYVYWAKVLIDHPKNCDDFFFVVQYFGIVHQTLNRNGTYTGGKPNPLHFNENSLTDESQNKRNSETNKSTFFPFKTNVNKCDFECPIRGVKLKVRNLVWYFPLLRKDFFWKFILVILKEKFPPLLLSLFSDFLQFYVPWKIDRLELWTSIFVNMTEAKGEVGIPLKRFKPPSILILTIPRRYFCCGSLLLFVLAVCIYTLVQLLC